MRADANADRSRTQTRALLAGARGWPRRPIAASRVLFAALVVAIAVVPAAVHALPSAATTLYVNQASSSCSDTGPGTATQPYCTISAAASKTVAGTTVLVSAGTYVEQVSVKSGAANNPVVFQAAPGSTVTVRGKTYGFYVSGKSWVTIQGFDVTATTDNGVHISSSSNNIKVIGNHVSYAGQPASNKSAKGIQVSDASDVVLDGNRIDHISNYGVYVLNSTRVQLVGNDVAFNAKVFQRAASGIRLYNSSSNTVSGNVSHDNEDSGIEVVTGSTNNVVVNNVAYGNGDHGIDTLDATGQKIVGNSVYNNFTAGINVEGASSGATIANNISIDNALNSTRARGNIRVDTTSISGTTIDYDVVFLRTPGNMIEWGKSVYGSIAELTAATGQEAHGIEADPKWVSPATGDFHLVSGSRAIDSANSSVSGQAATDAEGTARIDDLRTVNTGVGPRAYDDRGAYEFKAATLARIAISPASATIAAGGSQAFTAEGFDSSDTSFGDVTASTTFSIAPDGSCAGNVCTATKAGPHTVTGNNSGKVSTASLTVTAAALHHLVLAPPVSAIAAGESKSYTAEGRDQYENSLGDVTSTTAFSISPNGSCAGATCTASVAGLHTVTGTRTGKTGAASVQVSAGALDHIVIGPSTATIAAGGSRSYTANGYDAYGNATGDVTSSTVFSMFPNGSCSANVCTATAAGAHTVTGNNSGKTSSATLEVTAGALDHLALSPSAATVAAGAAQSYTAEGRDQYDNPLGDLTASTTFSIGPDGACTAASCTATAAGAHTVTATSGGKTGTASLSVTAAALDHLVLTPASASIVAGRSQTYTAEARDRYENSLGDATPNTTFAIAPDGSCSLATCTATIAGAHTVTGTLAGATGTASLDVTAAAVLDHIVISPATGTIAAGGTQAYTAEGFDESGNSLGDVTATTTFSVAPDGSCSGSVCTASVAGAHTITANNGGKTATSSLTVSAGALDHLALSPGTATIAAGASNTYTAEGRDEYGNSLGDVTSTTTFTISPNGSCSADACTATSAGAHTITGTSAGKTGTASLTVTAAALDHLVLAPASATIPSEGSQSYTAEGRDQYENSLGDATADTTFTIAPDGSCAGATCTASSAGPHTVTGTVVSAVGTASLDVTAGATIDHIVVTPADATIAAGGSQAYAAEGFDGSGNSLGDVTTGTVFTISPNGSCGANVCTATAAGAHTISATAEGKTTTASLTVTAGPLDHLALTPAAATIASGESQAYAAEGRDQYGNSLGDLTSNTTFSIAPDGSCSGATCTASAAGAHTVTGASAGKTGTASLQVTGGAVDHIVISPQSATIVAGGSQAYTAQGFDAANNSLGDVTSATTFTIAPDGSCSGNVCTATIAGAHTVTGNDGGKTHTASLTVNAGALDHLALSPASATIASGGSQAYTAEGRDQYDNALGDVTATTTFTIAPNGSCTGASCTASAAGAHTVTGKNAGKTGTASLQVTGGGLDHIVISPATATISAGASQTYTATGFDASGNSLGDVTANTTFTVTPNGSCSGSVCTASAVGPHTVTANDGGKTSTASLTVNAGPLDHLALSPASATIASGGSQTYTAEARDQYDNPLGNLTSSTTFTIAPNGSCAGATCTATTAGAHTVTGTSTGKTGSASLTVTGGALDRIVISPANATIVSGGSQAYTAEGFDAANNSLGDVTSATTFTISPNGACTGSVCTATAGGPHTVTASNAGKTSAASLAINLVKNPGFETDTSGWNTSGSGANIALSRVAGGRSGGWMAQLANTGTAASTYAALQDSPNWVATTSAGTYTATIWVRADSAGAVFKLKLQEFSGGTLVGSAVAQVTLTTSWQQVTLSYTPKSPGSTLDFQTYVTSPAPGVAFYADDVSIILG